MTDSKYHSPCHPGLGPGIQNLRLSLRSHAVAVAISFPNLYSLVVILEPHLGRFPEVLVLEARGASGIQNLRGAEVMRISFDHYATI
jgi:hypothetical protein